MLVMPSVALAHLVNSGLGPVYDGALHLLLSPGDLLGLVAFALLAGLRGVQAGRMTVLCLTIVWLLAGLVGLNLSHMPGLPLLVVVSLVVPGVMVAFDLKLPAILVAGLAGSYGALHGLLNGYALAETGAGVTALLGIVMTVFLTSLLISAAIVPLQGIWSRIVVRVAGSWVAAVGILMFGWLTQGNV
jgi:hydrogenase/urease accessory protein HupE